VLKWYRDKGVEEVEGVVIEVEAGRVVKIGGLVGVLLKVHQGLVDPPEVPDVQPGIAAPGEDYRVAEVQDQGK
jgi:hypothetical protein